MMLPSPSQLLFSEEKSNAPRNPNEKYTVTYIRARTHKKKNTHKFIYIYQGRGSHKV